MSRDEGRSQILYIYNIFKHFKDMHILLGTVYQMIIYSIRSMIAPVFERSIPGDFPKCLGIVACT